MSEKMTFRARIENAGEGGAFVRVPFDVEQVYGKKRVKIKALIENVPYRGLLVRMGEPWHMLIILKHIREKIGKSFGDEVEVTVEEDVEPRVVQVPADLQQLLDQNPAAQAFFKELAYTNQKEYVAWVTSAKREATRQERLTRTIELLAQGKRSR
jgi:hypothetical protein